MRRRNCNEDCLTGKCASPYRRDGGRMSWYRLRRPAAVVETVQARVVESQEQEVPVNLRSTGTVHARETAVLSAQVMGRIQQVLVHEGDSVRAGQTLVVLDDAALRSALEQAQAGLKAAQNAQAAAQTNASLATSTLNRYKQLETREERKPAGDG